MTSHLSELLEQAKWSVSEAIARGAGGARATAQRATESTVEWRNGKLDRIRESTSASVSIALFVDGKYSSSTTNDLRKASLEKFIADAIGMTRALTRDPHRALADPKRYEARFSGELGVWDEPTSRLGPDWRRRTAAELEAAARATSSSDQILSVETQCTTNSSERAKASSNGMEGTFASTSASLMSAVTVRDTGGKKPEGWWAGAAVRTADLPAVEQVGRRATERAVARVGAARRPTGKYECVIDNVTASRLIDGLLVALEGSNVQQRRSFLAGKLGQKVGSDALDIIDDPHLKGGLGSATYDAEGMSTRPRALFERGALKSYFLDSYYAKKLGLEATSGGRTNLVWRAGKRDLEALLRAMGTGVLVTGFNGGNTNSATGDFSYGVQGHWVVGGKVASPVTEMNLGGNHLDFWKKLIEVGNDPFAYSSHRRPSLRFDKVQFSGS